MKNIWQIFKTDVLRLRNNAVGLLVILGVVVVPSLYAWFNTAASWDPYANTAALQVAVASIDEGYTGELIPMTINMGESVLAKLHENNQLNWTFTSEQDAIEGVRSGDYYAAIIIPKEFSKEMMSIFSPDVNHPEILYYCNEKENAIAPKVTDKGASALQKQINEVFVQTLTDTVFVTLESVMDSMDEDDTIAFFDQVIENLETVSAELDSATGTLQAFSNLTDATVKMLDSSNSYLGQSQKLIEYSMDALNQTSQPLSEVKTAINGATDSVNTALATSKSYYQKIAEEITNSLSGTTINTENLINKLDSMVSGMGTVISSYEDIISAIEEIQEEYPELSGVTGPLLAKLNQALSSQKALQEQLSKTIEQIRGSSGDIDTAKTELTDLIAQSMKDIADVETDYEEKVEDNLNSLYSSVDRTKNSVSTILGQIDDGTNDLDQLTGNAASDLTNIQTLLQSTSETMAKASDKLDKTIAYMKEAKKNKDLAAVDGLLSSGQEAVSGFLASPVELKTNKIYPVENYGSSMAPFYSALSIWVGGIVLVAMLKVDISEKNQKKFKNLRPWQAYFGRFLLFMIIGLFQSTLICLGDLYYLQIQCEHPFLFLLVGWVSSIVYVQIIYTLTISFGDIGKAICVVLLVMQVAGSGGTFPIETAPAFFKACYPFFPFGHTMNAMRECIAGFYGNVYWKELFTLGYYIIASLVLGIILRVPLIRFNKFFTEKLESTHLI